MGLYNWLKEVAPDWVFASASDADVLTTFDVACRLLFCIWESAHWLSMQPYSDLCAIAASEFLRLLGTYFDYDNLRLTFNRACMMTPAEYRRVFTREHRRSLEGMAKRWSDEEALVQEFSFLRSGDKWLIYALSMRESYVNYEAIEAGLKGWMEMQNDRRRMPNVCNNQ